MNALLSISPFLCLGTLTVLLMLVIAFTRNHLVIASITFTGLIFSLFLLNNVETALPIWANSFIVNDSFSLYANSLIIIGTLLIIPFAYNYFNKRTEQTGEFYILLVASALGAVLMASAKNVIALFLGLELLSIPIYALIAYNRENKASISAAIKYIVLATVSSSVMLFGFALLYAWGGTLNLIDSTQKLINSPLNTLAILGLTLTVIAIGFKLALAPFHIWTPDVYQGSPAPSTAFLASVSKIGAFVFIVRYLQGIQLNPDSNLVLILTILAILSMFAGNLLAMRQTSVKRLLAGSSIAHVGYLLIAIITGGVAGNSAATFYITVYVISTVGIFGILAILSGSDTEIDHIDNLNGLFQKKPWLAIIFTTLIMSLAGIPLTAGFLAKFYIVFAGATMAQWILISLLIVNSIIALYYYLKVVASMFKTGNNTQTFPTTHYVVYTTAAIIFIIIIWLGVMPGNVMNIINRVLIGI